MVAKLDRKYIYVLFVAFVLAALGLILALTSSSNAQNSPFENDAIIESVNFMPMIANDYDPNCWLGITNGSFEYDADWIIPVTEYSAGYSNTVAFSGNQSMRAGITESQDNRFSYSSARQIVTLPDTATNAVLSFWLYPKSSESTNLSLPKDPLGIKKENAADSGDAQLVLILDKYGGEVERLLTMRRSDELWLPYSFDISRYAGQTIQVYFDVYNNGWDGVTSMYVDDVSIKSCSDVPPPPICWQGIANESFEDTTGWVIPITAYPAAYSTEQATTGKQSMRAGITDPLDNRFSYSSTIQMVQVPDGATDATLEFWLYPMSSEPEYLKLPTILENLDKIDAASWGDVQVVIIYDAVGNELERPVHMRRSDADWLPYSFDLSQYAGETIQIYFGVINNGTYGITSMYVDDVTLSSCEVSP